MLCNISLFMVDMVDHDLNPKIKKHGDFRNLTKMGEGSNLNLKTPLDERLYLLTA